ncbi:MAG TPA: CDP-alcohol phosphatidyltransferase family protein [Dongiaceae bacterium]|nr:CDP-alcohol phosphatidyltransferase family protein [Dongiaceae bacterium]
MFIEEYLQELRRDGFTPAAFARYLHRVARNTRESLDVNPGGVRAVWSVALGFFAVAFVASAAVALRVDRGLALELLLWTSVWILLAFAAVTASISLLRDPQGYRLASLNVPLVLTLARVVLVPGISLLLLDRHYSLALGVYLVAALSDIADGWIARRWSQVTELGTLLDPVVDIVFNFALFAGLALAGLLPKWVFAMAALRYGVLVAGATCLYVFVGPVRIRPTTLGRLMGVVTSALIALLPILHINDGHFAERLMPLTAIALGVLLAAGVLHALALGWYNLRMMRGAVQAQGRVVGDVRWGKQ